MAEALNKELAQAIKAISAGKEPLAKYSQWLSDFDGTSGGKPNGGSVKREDALEVRGHGQCKQLERERDRVMEREIKRTEV